jgi:hypothetical protein
MSQMTLLLPTLLQEFPIDSVAILDGNLLDAI